MKYIALFIVTLALMPVLAPAAGKLSDAYQTAKGTSTRDPLPSENHRKRQV